MQHPLDWDKLRVFHACAEAGSFTGAAQTLRITQSAISRQISALEYDIKMQLFTRHARGLILTEHGEALYSMTRNVMLEINKVQEVLSDIKNKPKGRLKVSAPFSLGTSWLVSKLPEFQKLYNEIHFQLKLIDGDLDLTSREAHCSIRLGRPEKPDIIQRYLFDIKLFIYVSVGYIKQNGIPKNVEEISKHPLITYGDCAPSFLKKLNWLETHLPPGIKPRLQVNNLAAIKTAAKAGLGLALLPDYIVHESDNMISILTDIPDLPVFPAYFCYHESMKNSARVRAFGDFLFNKAKNWPQ